MSRDAAIEGSRGLPGQDAHTHAEKMEPEILDGCPDLMAKRQPTEHQTHTEAHKRDHAVLVRVRHDPVCVPLCVSGARWAGVSPSDPGSHPRSLAPFFRRACARLGQEGPGCPRSPRRGSFTARNFTPGSGGHPGRAVNLLLAWH